ncbi:MAG: VCBS repeat-containing protein [Deltaproteobacteria bacterium]
MKKILIAIVAALMFLSPGIGDASDKPSLAILPLRLNAPPGMDYLKGAYNDVLSARITAAGGVLVADPAKLRVIMDKHPASEWSEETTKSLAGEIGTGFVLQGSLSVIGDDLSLDVRLIKVNVWNVTPISYKGKGVGAFTEMLEKTAIEARRTILGVEAGRPNLPVTVREKSWKSHKVPLALKGIGVADLDNDGAVDLAAIDEKNLYIYSVDKEGVKLKREFKGGGAVSNYNIVVGDFNANGFPEIYLTRRYLEKAATRVIEYTGNDFTVIADDLPWFIREIKGQDKKLVGEKFRQIDGLYGGVKLLKWKEGRMAEDGPLDMPKWMDLYGFTICDATGDGKNDFIYLDENDRLRLYEKDDGGGWKQIWQSTGYYGGSINNIEYGPNSTEQKSINVKAAIQCGKVVEEGRREIITSSNDAVSRVFKNTAYESGVTKGLLWGEFGFEDRWQTRKINGYVADFVVADIKKDGFEEIVELVVVKQPSLFSTGESLIVTLTPEPKSGN